MSLFMSLMAVAQYSVKFLATDSTGEGEPYATVRIFKTSDLKKVVATGVTDLQGHFSQNLSTSGEYRLLITAVGKVETRRDFSVNGQSPAAHLDTIVLGADAHALQGVTVTAQAPLVSSEIDRLSYNVQSDDDSKTKTIFEMLRKVPMVSIDGQDNIRVRGSGSFKIYKNGHPDPSMSKNPKEVLKSIPASMIKKIEVITEPGAKYDAEGVNAILNIVTLDNVSVKGVTGTASADISTDGSPGASAFLTTQVGKFISSINYGYNRQSRSSNRQHSETETRYNESGNTLTNRSNGDASANVHYGNIESSYEPDTLNLLTLSFGGYYYDYSGQGTGSYSLFDSQGQPLYSYNRKVVYPKNSYYSFDGRFDYQHKTRVKDEALTLSYMLSTSRNRSNQVFSLYDIVNAPFPYSGYSTDGKENFWEHTFQFDWTRPFARYHKFETGLKYIYRQNKSHTLMNYVDAESMNTDTRFDHLTQVAAAYASYTFNKDKWSARAGLRYEYSFLQGKYPDGSKATFHRHLSDFVPSASVNYQFDWANSLKFSFSTSINRPGISYLNPAVIDNPSSISYGNAQLGSARNHAFSLTFMHIGQKLTFNIFPSYTFSNNQITGVQFVKDNKTVSTYANELCERSWSLGAYVQWNVIQGTSLMFNGSVSYNDLKSDNLGLQNCRWFTTLWAQLTQQLPWKLRFSAFAGQFGGEVMGLYGHRGNMYFYNLDLQRSFLKEDRLTVRLTTQRPFSGKYNRLSSYTDHGDYTAISRNWFTSRRFAISISYRFGSLKASVKKTDTTIENNDVVGGNRKGGGNAQGK